MNAMLWIAILTAFFLQIETSITLRHEDAFLSAQAASITTNMMVYKSAVSLYASSNPAYSGTVPDNALALPAWFNKFPGIANYANNGTAYIYYVTPIPGLAQQLLQSTNNSITTGFKHNGLLVNPYVYTTSISLPSAIPESAVVLF
jgi:hypothetical protein